MEYNFREIEKKWQKRWVDNGTYRVVEDEKKKKFYVLNMFPYPSGAGLHVGHPLGYIASDIYARYKRLKGFNVLNPMGYDAYGLPAEQYAIQTGQHPAITTEQNISRYREQLDKIGFSFDWSREVRTCDPKYYKWTQWAFQRMFRSYFSTASNKAQPTIKLIEHFELMGTENCHALGTEELHFTASEWHAFSEKKKQEVLMNYRIAYLAETMVNWCPALGTVLANDEVVNGVSERGGYPVEQKKMRQWCLRVSAYAQRLLDGLDTIDWSDSIKEAQRNWIGRSEGTEMVFKVAPHSAPEAEAPAPHSAPEGATIDPSAKTIEAPSGAVGGATPTPTSFTIFTTRADTIFGVTFMVLAPESELVDQLTTPEQRKAVDKYLAYVKKRTERERQMDHSVTGVFSGSYAINPFTGEKIPIWIAEYVLAGYGTGAIMAVPAHDSRDYAFARHFNLPIIPLIEGADVSEQSFDAKEGIVMNSPKSAVPAGRDSIAAGAPPFSLNGLTVKEAIAATKKYVTETGIGRVKVNYRLRDAIFSRQRYWGEPFPIYYKDDMPYIVPKECLPLELPDIDEYKPTATGEPPLGRAKKWAWDTKTDTVVDCSLIDNKTVFPLELNTMPGFAGSSAYYLRYMDPSNDKALVGRDADEYWRSVDLYVGGTEHATGHLIYSRFWNKFLYDCGYSCEEEPFRKLHLPHQGHQPLRQLRPAHHRVRQRGQEEPLLLSVAGGRPHLHRHQHCRGQGAQHRPHTPVDARLRPGRVHHQCRRQVHRQSGHREDVEVEVQRRQPRRHLPALRCRHAPPLRDVPRSHRAVEALGRGRHRRLSPLPTQVLEPRPGSSSRSPRGTGPPFSPRGGYYSLKRKNYRSPLGGSRGGQCL